MPRRIAGRRGCSIVGATLGHRARRRAPLRRARRARSCWSGAAPSALEATAADLRVRGAADVAPRVLERQRPAAPRRGASTPRCAPLSAASTSCWSPTACCPTRPLRKRVGRGALAQFDTNARSVIALLTDLAKRFERRARRHRRDLVAGRRRGRASNYVYGAAKAAVAAFASGCATACTQRRARRDHRARLRRHADDRSLREGPAVGRPERVAADIERALDAASASSTRPGSGAGSWRSFATFRSAYSFE